MYYKIFPSFDREHVLIERQRIDGRNPNYRGTGLALCGVIPEGKCLHDWVTNIQQKELERAELEQLKKKRKKK